MILTFNEEDDVGLVLMVEVELLHPGSRLVVQERADAGVQKLLVRQLVPTDRGQLRQLQDTCHALKIAHLFLADVIGVVVIGKMWNTLMKIYIMYFPIRFSLLHLS